MKKKKTILHNYYTWDDDISEAKRERVGGLCLGKEAIKTDYTNITNEQADTSSVTLPVLF